MDDVTLRCGICGEVKDDPDTFYWNGRTGNHSQCEWTVEDQPAEDDIYLTDDLRTRRPCATQNGKIILRSEGGEPVPYADIRAWMERSNYWPNVWRISDHGNIIPVDISED